ncbi:hypothetical protein [Leptolyngbya sp. BC1307]|uniref:hypothetical protein n=1 Tax=Leptolyngbya sp. BC1307 TaxID=2029589 RepID=UPI0011410623|nr:hypothetical protein [Leptolyngbya sp. BC1307]
MKRQLLSVLLLTVTMTAIPSIAKASSLNLGGNIQQTRLQNLDTHGSLIYLVVPKNMKTLYVA